MNTNIIIEIALATLIPLAYVLLGYTKLLEKLRSVTNRLIFGGVVAVLSLPFAVAAGAFIMLAIRVQCWMQHCNPVALRAALGL